MHDTFTKLSAIVLYPSMTSARVIRGEELYHAIQGNTLMRGVRVVQMKAFSK